MNNEGLGFQVLLSIHQYTRLLFVTLAACGSVTWTPGCATGRDATVVAPQRSTREWQTDIFAFDQYLGELVAQAHIPTAEDLRARRTPDSRSEVATVTDGAGGYVDLEPPLGSLQHDANEVMIGKRIAWTFRLHSVYTTHDLALLQPDLTDDAAEEPGGRQVRFLASLILQKPYHGEQYQVRAGDRVTVTGLIGDFSKNRASDVKCGPIVVYYLDIVPHPVFWIGLTDARITIIDGSTSD